MINGCDVRLCPSPAWSSPTFQSKGTDVIFSYGCNAFVFGPGHSLMNEKKLLHPSTSAIFADAAQVVPPFQNTTPDVARFQENYFLDDATRYLNAPNNYYPNGHFRHTQTANVIFADGHVAAEKPVAGSIDPRLPSQFIGQLRPEILTLP